jgi:hypothetical protein
MSDHPRGTVKRTKANNSPASPAMPVPDASIEHRDFEALSRIVVGFRRDDLPALQRLPQLHRHQAVLAMHPAVGNTHVQRVLSPRAPGIQRGPKEDKAALDAAKADAVSAGASVTALEKLIAQDRADVSLGKTAGGREVKAVYFKGAIDEVALVIAGVHGSELSGVEIAERLIKLLSDPKAPRPFFTVVIVPQLFPDNVDAKRTWEKSVVKAGTKLKLDEYQKARAKAKDPGRYTAGSAVDPNRQFPELGKPFDPNNPVDAKGRPIERENIMLLTLIDRFKPMRIASLHAIKDPKDAGIYADPHPSTITTAGPQKELGERADKLAQFMAEEAKKRGAKVPGNFREGSFSSLYPGQDPKLSEEQIKKENKKGRSFGQWGPGTGALVLTIEVNEQHASDSSVEHPGRDKELEGHAQALKEIFVGPSLGTFLVEEVIDPIKEGWKNVRDQFLGDGGTTGGDVKRLSVPGSLPPGPVQSLPVARSAVSDIARWDLSGLIAWATAAKHYTIEPGITLTSDAETVVDEIADAYYAKTNTELVVTSGTRTAASQADAMYIKLEIGDDVVKLYGGGASVKAIKKAYDDGKAAGDDKAKIVDAMTKVIEGQMAKGVYISKHLKAGAVDIRSRDMTDKEKKAFRKAAKGKVKSILLETKPPHWHLQL